MDQYIRIEGAKYTTLIKAALKHGVSRATMYNWIKSEKQINKHGIRTKRIGGKIFVNTKLL